MSLTQIIFIKNKDLGDDPVFHPEYPIRTKTLSQIVGSL